MLLRVAGRLALGLALIACLWISAQGARRHHEEDERLIGWQGENYKPFSAGEEAVNDTSGIHGTPLFSENETHRKGWIQTISWRPRAVVYHNFLSDREARHIIDLAHAQMKRSTVVGNKNQGVVDDIRTSYGTFLRRNQDPVIRAIEERLAVWSHLPASHQEDMQVLRYGPTNKYGPHIDGLERVATVLMYLVPPDEGGETAFVDSVWSNPKLGEAAEAEGLSKCAHGHVAYKPKRGDALMFFDMTPDYMHQDQHSMHTGCPVVAGVKWNAVKWIHGKPFREDEWIKYMTEPYQQLPDPGMCANFHEMCDTWATQGECEKNPGYMIGSNSGMGQCRLACKDCELCAEGDKDCYHRNRESGGFLNFDESELKGL